jgi:hypothetical protein
MHWHFNQAINILPLENYGLIVEREFALPGELCWRKRKHLVGPPMPDRSKGRGQMKCSPWSSRLWFGEIHYYENFRAYGGGQDPQRVVAPVKKNKHTVTCRHIATQRLGKHEY